MNDFPYPPTSPPPPRSAFFEDPFYEQPRYFLHACFLCNKPLGQSMDIYMYRGDTPFCSEECRQEQIGINEAMERNQIQSLTGPPSNPSSTFQDKFSDFLQRVGSILS
ncbi:hypothetical protein MRB53_000877 [Persea americana]|uniref:Uncharacterized protein n=1 Tax=Persea americana TaxID=3435 RepID=A0ACC2MQ89_PERAE|nr:hypothetical protein MRB53_000877 [Persea americana]